MGNKCSLCMNCYYKECTNRSWPCEACVDGFKFKNGLSNLMPQKQGPDSICKTCRYRIWPSTNEHCSTCNAYGSSYVHYPIRDLTEVPNISDTYCKRCKNNPFACSDCIINELSDGSYMDNVPSKFEEKRKNSMHNHNMNWIADMIDNIEYDPSIIDKIEKIIFSGPATIVFWQGGGKTIVKYHKEKGCTYRKDLGVLYCIFKHYICLDNTKLFHKFLKGIDEVCEAENGDKTT